MPDYQFIVAGIPIVVTNELEIYTEAEINLEGNIGVSYELTAETTQGFNYNSKTGKVEEINQVTCESDGYSGIQFLFQEIHQWVHRFI